MGDGCCESMVHGVSLETSQHRGASTVKQRLLSSSMFCPHQHTGPIAACRMHLSVVLRFSVLTKGCKGKALIVLLVFSYLLFPFSRVSLSILFFSNLRHHIPSVRHRFLVRQMPRLLFMIHGCSMNVLQGIPSLRVQIECVRTAAAFRMGNRCTRSMGCKWMHCKAFPS